MTTLTANKFKSTDVKGIFQNLDDTVNDIDADAYIQRDLTIDGYLIPNQGIKLNITVEGVISSYYLTNEILYYLSSINSDVQTQLDLISSNVTNIETNIAGISYSSLSTNISNVLNVNGGINIPSSQLLTLIGNIFCNNVSITPTVLSYISTLSSNAQTQISSLQTSTLTNISNISSLTTQVNNLNTKTTGMNYAGSNTLFSNLLYANAGLNIPINQVLTILGTLYVNSISITPTQLSYLSNCSSNIQSQLNLLAPLESPNFTGNAKCVTQLSTDISTNIATTEFVNTAINNLVGGASSAYNTLVEIQNALLSDSSSIAALSTSINSKASLSDIQANNNNWLGSNSFDSYLPTSVLTPTLSSQFITKSYADSTYSTSGSILSLSNTFTGSTNTFQNVIMNSLTASSINNSGVLNSTGLITCNGGINIPSGQLLTLIGNLYANSTTISPILLSYLSGCSSNIQTQLNTKTTLATIQSNNNVFTGTNVFNTSLPTSNLTPSSNSDFITKLFGDNNYSRLNSTNTFSATNNFANTTTTGFSKITSNEAGGKSIELVNKSDNTYSTILFSGAGYQNYNQIVQTGDAGITWGNSSSYGFCIAPWQTGNSGSRWDNNGNLSQQGNLTMGYGKNIDCGSGSITCVNLNATGSVNLSAGCNLNATGSSIYAVNQTLSGTLTMSSGSTTSLQTTTSTALTINNTSSTGRLKISSLTNPQSGANLQHGAIEFWSNGRPNFSSGIRSYTTNNATSGNGLSGFEDAGDLEFYTSSGSAGGTRRMIISENGNVNIGSGYASNSYLLTISGNSNHTGQAVFSSTNTPISIVGPSTSSSGTSIQMATRFGSGKFTYIFNGANVNSFNNTSIVAADCGIAYSNNTGSSGFLICPQLSSAASAGSRWDSSGNITQTGLLTINSTSSLGQSIILTNKQNSSISCSFVSGTSLTKYNDICQVGDSGITWGLNSSYGFFISPNRNTAPTSCGLRMDSVGNITQTGNLTVTNNIITSNNIYFGSINESNIIVSNTTLTFPLTNVIFVNATTTPLTLTLPALTSANSGLNITIRALPTCTNTVTVQFSSSQVMYNANSSTSSTSYPLINTSSTLNLTAINNYWLQI